MTIPLVSYPNFINYYAKYFTAIVTAKNLDNLKSCLAGIICLDNPTLSAISQFSAFKKTNYERVQYFVSESNWNADDFNRRRLELITNQPKLKGISGIGAIDDSLTHKSGKEMEEVCQHYDHGEGKMQLGHNLVTSFFIHPLIKYPIVNDIYVRAEDCLKQEKDFKSKQQIAKKQIIYAQKSNLPIDTWVYDSWFLSKELTEIIEKNGQDWISILKTNRIIIVNGQRMSVGEYAKTITSNMLQKTTIKNVKNKSYFYFTKTFTMSKQGKVRLVFTKEQDKPKDSFTILVTNRTDWEKNKIIKTYAQRWEIETFFRDSKQNLGLEDYQLRKIKGLKHYFNLVFLAYTILQLKFLQAGLKEKIKHQLHSIGAKCRYVFNELIHIFIKFIYTQLKSKKDIKQVYQLIDGLNFNKV